MAPLKIIGITGGIGSGKSTVAKLLQINGVPVYDTDLAAKKIYDSSPLIREKLSARFGPDLYRPDGRLDRKKLAERIFTSPEDRLFVNSLVHPAVEQDFEAWVRSQPGQPLLGVESALLFESNLKHRIHFSINVSAPTEIRIRRTQNRDHSDRETVLQRIQNQMTDRQRSALADHTLLNDDRLALLPQVENCLKIAKSK
jgi:dephospho-CoA kinase